MKRWPYVAVLFFICFAGCENKPSVEQKTVAKKSKATLENQGPESKKSTEEKSEPVDEISKSIGQAKMLDQDTFRTHLDSGKTLLVKGYPGFGKAEKKLYGKNNELSVSVRGIKGWPTQIKIAKGDYSSKTLIVLEGELVTNKEAIEYNRSIGFLDGDYPELPVGHFPPSSADSSPVLIKARIVSVGP